MYLTTEQRKTLKDASIDEDAYQRILSVIDELHHDTPSQQDNSTAAALNNNGNLEKLDVLFQAIQYLPFEAYVKDRDSRFVTANQQTLNVLKVTSLDKIVGKTDFELSSSEFAQHYYDEEQALIANKQPIIDREMFVTDNEGNPIWFQYTKTPLFNQGEVVGLLGLNHNITQRKLIECDLEKERKLLKTLLDHIKDTIYIKDCESRFIFGNKATLVQKSMTHLDELVGTTDYDNLAHERADVFFQEERLILETGEPIIDKEIYLDESAGVSEPRWVLYSKLPMRNSEGEIIGLVGINRDINAQKLAAQKTLETELEREKSEFLGSFITSASHEFFTPLSIIRTASYLITKLSTDDKQLKYTSQISQQTERLETLIDSMLFMVSLDQIQTIDMHYTNLEPILGNAVDHMQKKGLHNAPNIEWTANTTKAYGWGNETLLFRALVELLDNAIQFASADDTIQVLCQSNEIGVNITISDTGSGMTDDTLNSVFQRFYRDDKVHATSGFGLGLPIVQRIVDLHHGTITLTSEVDKGTTVNIQLPHHLPETSDIPSAD